MNGPVIGFAGLTHLGLVSAVGTASKGFNVIGYDADQVRVAAIAAGKLPVLEPGLDDLAREHSKRPPYTNQLSDLGACDVVYIATDVPTDDLGQSDLSGIADLIGRVFCAWVEYRPVHSLPGSTRLYARSAFRSPAALLPS